MVANTTHFNTSRFLKYLFSLSSIAIGLCIIVIFSGPIVVAPRFYHEAQIIIGLGIFCLAIGSRGAALLFFGSEPCKDLNAIKNICTLGMLFAICVIVIGTWSIELS